MFVNYKSTYIRSNLNSYASYGLLSKLGPSLWVVEILKIKRKFLIVLRLIFSFQKPIAVVSLNLFGFQSSKIVIIYWFSRWLHLMWLNMFFSLIYKWILKLVHFKILDQFSFLFFEIRKFNHFNQILLELFDVS